MCGLMFLLGDEGTASPDLQARLQAAMELLRHRGPDAQQVVHGAGFVAGHTRLAIIDLNGGQQPRQDTQGRYTLVFNGEIYNYRQLREQIGDAWNFRDASDTEVMLAGLVREGADFINRLDGMWAFVLHDAATGTLLLSRDRFGKKPLYYHNTAHGIICASELPVLRALSAEPFDEDVDSVADYFRYGYALPGHTCLNGVREVLPGHWLRRDASGVLDEQRYWMPSTTPSTDNHAAIVEQVREKLTAAVLRRQLAADVEVGAFLSGGIDSTVICALAQASGERPLQTFTIGFDEPTFDERVHAARAAKAIGTIHHAGSVDPIFAASFAAGIPRMLGQPFGDASLVPTAMVARLASEHVKVVLSGDGADEVFGGYARYAGRLLSQRYAALPALARRSMAAAIRTFPEPIDHHSGSLLKKAHLFLKLADESSADYVAPRLMTPEYFSLLLPDSRERGHRLPVSPWPRDEDEVRHMMLMDWLVYLPQDILAKVDRATMAYSVEARTPFLDRELVELVLRLPRQWHFKGLSGKRLLREAMKGRVPDIIWSRRKQGFASPVGHWLKGRLGDELVTMLWRNEPCAIDPTQAHRMLTEHRSGRADHTQALWLVHGYLAWRQPAL